jgi:5-methyltetrahydrofolate--homocysteine methyltransferase
VGAEILDVNGGLAGQEVELLPWLVETVQDEVSDEVPLCLDSPNGEALTKALPLCRRPPLINSITAEEGRLQVFLPLIREYDAGIIALCMTERPPTSADERLSIAGTLVERLTGGGVPAERIYIDPCVFPVSTDAQVGVAVLTTLAAVKAKTWGVKTVCGLSNVSYGLPARKLLNHTFMILTMAQGLDAVIVDPCDPRMMAGIIAARALLGEDEYCMGYLTAHQTGKLEVEGT